VLYLKYMKSILKCILAVFILFSTIDLSVINLFSTFNFDIKATTSISEIIETECKVFQQVKIVVATVCDNIAKDVISLLAPTQQNNVFFATGEKERKLGTDICFNFVKVVLSVFGSSISYVLKDTKVPLFFFVFVFVFLLRYLGLLFTFDGITIYKRYKKAYSM